MSTAQSIPIHAEPYGDEWHIAGVVVHARPESLAAVEAAIGAMSGAEIHARSDAGKLVVTLEGPGTRAISAHLMFLHQLDGVLSAALVYQHGESDASMAETIDTESGVPSEESGHERLPS